MVKVRAEGKKNEGLTPVKVTVKNEGGASLLDAGVATVAADRVTLCPTGGRDVVVSLS